MGTGPFTTAIPSDVARKAFLIAQEVSKAAVVNFDKNAKKLLLETQPSEKNVKENENLKPSEVTKLSKKDQKILEKIKQEKILEGVNQAANAKPRYQPKVGQGTNKGRGTAQIDM